MVWTPAQLGALLDAAEGDRLYSLFHLIAHRGLRRGEAIGLAWTDVDLDAGQLTVRRQRVQVGWDVIEDGPKSTAGGRTIALDRGTVDALRAHRRAQLVDRMAWGAPPGSTPAWCSPGRTGRRCTPSSPTGSTGSPSAAGLPPMRLHDLRHGAASDAGRRRRLKVVPGDARALNGRLHRRHLHQRLHGGGGRRRRGHSRPVPARAPSAHTRITHRPRTPAGQGQSLVRRWGGWGSNPRPDGL